MYFSVNYKRKQINPNQEHKSFQSVASKKRINLNIFPYKPSLNRSVYYELTMYSKYLYQDMLVRVIYYLYNCWRIYQIIFFSYYCSWCWNSIFSGQDLSVKNPSSHDHKTTSTVWKRELLSFLRSSYSREYAIS